MSADRFVDEKWAAVDRYFGEKLSLNDEALDAAMAANKAAGLPAIDVAPNQGKLLHLLAQMVGARQILEIGTLGGYSTIWLARALPADGKLTTLEFNPKHAEIASSNIAHAKLSQLVDIRIGAALETLAKMQEEEAGPFDLIFIDADKANNAEYLRWALKFSRRGTLMIIDNVVREGAVIDAASTDQDILGTRRLFDELAKEKRLSSTAIQTVGSKGYDGFVMAIMR